MERSEFWLYVLTILVFVGVIVFLIVFKGMEILEVLGGYGVPLLIYIVICSAYPVYKLFKA